ncbi:MAG: hypothetical protein ACXVNQ_05295 [Bacteroidia bacterium]
MNWFQSLGNTFFNAGRNIVKSIYEGIKAFFMYPINKVKEMVSKIRNLLPYGPAKDGPLRDIHRIRLVETIAESIRPNALIDKMRTVTAHTFDVMNGKPGRQLAPAAMAGNRVTVSPTFNFHLSGFATKQDASMLGREVEKTFAQLMKKYQGQQSRIALG